mgnify:CR=1 FL=1|jgi:hypothetical protein
MTKDLIIPIILFVVACLVAYFAWATGNLPR